MRNLMTIGLSFALAAGAVGQDIPSVGPQEALAMLNNPSSYLVDVRSVAEYTLVGHPVSAFNVPFEFWSESRSTFEPNTGFIDDLKSRFKLDDTLIFICRGGGRSLRAAEAALTAGFRKCVNVKEGFEGEMDDSGKRTIRGWKNLGLPWTQKIDSKLAYPFRAAGFFSPSL